MYLTATLTAFELLKYYFECFCLDPKIQAAVQRQLITGNHAEMAAVCRAGGLTTNTVHSHQRPEPAVHQSYIRTNGACSEEEALLSDHFEEKEQLQWEPLSSNESHKPKHTAKFEAYMMTGEHILNISRTSPQFSPLSKQASLSYRCCY